MNDHTFEDIQFLLKRNWFVDDEGIYELLYSLTDPEWIDIVKNINQYPPNIRETIRSIIPLKSKLVIKEYSDEDMNRHMVDERASINEVLDMMWEEHKFKNKISPPQTFFQTRHDELKEKLDFEKSKLSLYKNPPASLSKSMDELRTEMESLLNNISGYNKAWEEYHKSLYILNETMRLL